MKTIKKLLILAMAAALAAGLAACGNSAPKQPELTSAELYQKYLNNEIQATVNCTNFGSAVPGDVLTISELVYGEADWLEDYFLGDVFYGYIDCGMDGEEELLVAARFITPGDYDFLEEQFIVKAYGQDLKIISEDDSFARATTTVSDTGLIEYFGSNGAASYYEDSSYINAAGEKIFLYSVVYETGLSDAVIPEYYIPEDAAADISWDYTENGYEIDIYNFEEYISSDEFDAAVYDEYLRKAYFVFYAPDEKNVMPEASLMEFYENAGLNIVTEDDLASLVYDTLTERGVTDALMDGSAAELTLMDSEAVEWLPKG